MALLFKVFLRSFWVVVLGFHVAQSGDSETVHQAGVKETLVICENSDDDIHCPSGIIKIEYAYYGRTDAHTCPSEHAYNKECKAATSLDVVRIRCENQVMCHLEASDYLFGDPCPKTNKYLKVDYTCEDHYTRRALICEHKSENINCPEGKTIELKDVFWGRMDKTTCFDSNNTYTDTNCRSENHTFSTVNERCGNKKECKLDASNDWFGNPCVGSLKWLSVEYQCEYQGVSQRLNVNSVN